MKKETLSTKNISEAKSIAKKETEVKNRSISLKDSVWKKYKKTLEELNDANPEYDAELKSLSYNDLLEVLLPSISGKLLSDLKKKRITGKAESKAFKEKYESINGKITEDRWITFTMSADFQKFRKQNLECLSIFS